MSDSMIEHAQPEVLPYIQAKQAAVAAFEREYLARLMALTRGSVADAARMAGLDRANLRKLLLRHKLREPGAPFFRTRANERAAASKRRRRKARR